LRDFEHKVTKNPPDAVSLRLFFMVFYDIRVLYVAMGGGNQS